MNKEVKNNLEHFSSSYQHKFAELQVNKYWNGGKFSESTSRWVKCLDSVDDFINKHSVFIGNNTNNSTKEIQSIRSRGDNSQSVKSMKRNKYDSYLPETCLISGVKKLSKPTHRSPVQHFNNEILVSRIIENNMKLNKLVYTLVPEMLKAKQNRDWKSVIKLLRKIYDKKIEQKVAGQIERQFLTSKLSNNSYSSQLTWKLSNSLNNMHEENQKENSELSHRGSSERLNKHSSSVKTGYSLQSKLICYPTSSCGRITMLQRERAHSKLGPLTSKIATKRIKENVTSPIRDPCDKKEKRKSSSSQADSSYEGKIINRGKQDIATTEYHKPLNEIDLEEKHDSRINIIDQTICFANIATKIEYLIKSINLLIEEIKEQKTINKELISLNSEIKSINKTIMNLNEIQQLKTDAIENAGSLRNQKCEVTSQADSRVVKLRKSLTDKSIYAQYDKEIKTKSRRNIQDSCYFGSKFQISLAQKATETTESFLNPDLKVSKVIMTEAKSSKPDQSLVEKQTKEANTEALSVLALLRVSTETVKQLLSCMPTIDYYSYLPLLQLSYFNESEEPRYTCNICGAAFYKASMLNDHIKDHDLGSARDCCVCQHVLETHKLCNHELFKCQFCGQRFTRAYCCELHQQCCAKRLGVRHEVSSNLLLLQ